MRRRTKGQPIGGACVCSVASSTAKSAGSASGIVDKHLRHLHQRALEAAERRRQIGGAAGAIMLAAEQALAGDARGDRADVGADLHVARGARRKAVFLVGHADRYRDGTTRRQGAGDVKRRPACRPRRRGRSGSGSRSVASSALRASAMNSRSCQRGISDFGVGFSERRDRKNEVAPMSMLRSLRRHMLEDLRHARRLHEAVAGDHPDEGVGSTRSIVDALVARHARGVLGLDRQDDVALVQHAVVLQVVHERGRRRVGIGGRGTPPCRARVRRLGLELAHQPVEVGLVACACAWRAGAQPRTQVNMTSADAGRHQRAATSRRRTPSACWRRRTPARCSSERHDQAAPPSTASIPTSAR